uniref:Uncharacterized protein n=1 Tax=Acrobeloides nanus TaxID=290746 RepID=A0A914C3R8_9BILA
MINHLEDHPSSLYIQDSIGFELTGNGILDGQGHAWWYDFFNYVPHRDFRPYLFHMVRSKDVEIHNIHVRNSPCFHLNFYDMLNLHIHDLDIYVDFSSQQAMAEKRVWNWTGDFPANTDGIDLSGKNILVENVIIEVGDDGIAIKPANSRNMYSNCSQDMLIRNITTVYSLGMAVGSIGPDVSVNCIRNITFENIYHTYGSYRGFYIKTSNVGTGSGIVDNITVRNMTGYNNEAVFIYIGPMYQGPNANGSRCDGHWPTSLNATCDTQPLFLDAWCTMV